MHLDDRELLLQFKQPETKGNLETFYEIAPVEMREDQSALILN